MTDIKETLCVTNNVNEKTFRVPHPQAALFGLQGLAFCLCELSELLFTCSGCGELYHEISHSGLLPGH